jgi:hypothetical protein
MLLKGSQLIRLNTNTVIINVLSDQVILGLDSVESKLGCAIGVQLFALQFSFNLFSVTLEVQGVYFEWIRQSHLHHSEVIVRYLALLVE